MARALALMFIALITVPSFSTAEISPAEFEKLMAGYLTKDQNLDALGEALQSHFEKKRQQEAKRAEEDEASAMERQFENPAKIDIGKAPVRGNPNAKITIVEFSDFQCPFCQRGAQTMEEVLKAYPNDVRVAFKHFPLPFHPQAKPAAKASIAAGLQGKFWEMHDKLFSNQEQLSDEGYVKFAQEIGLDVEKFKSDMKNPDLDKLIQDDMAQGQKYGITGTPGFLVNGVAVKGARPLENFKTIIERWKAKL